MVRYAGDALVVSRPLDRPDAIISLASHEWERLPRAAELARSTPSAAVWLTVPVRVTRHNCENCGERVARLANAGVDPSRVVLLPDRVMNTHDEAKAAVAFARLHPVDRLVVVTSPFHTRRALATFTRAFEAAGLHTEVGMVTPVGQANPSHWWLRRSDRQYVAYEWAAIVYYGARYGVLPIVK
jgi:uncharacterized SAM-binding protein YcdF (DUF218 family)